MLPTKARSCARRGEKPGAWSQHESIERDHHEALDGDSSKSHRQPADPAAQYPGLGARGGREGRPGNAHKSQEQQGDKGQDREQAPPQHHAPVNADHLEPLDRRVACGKTAHQL